MFVIYIYLHTYEGFCPHFARKQKNKERKTQEVVAARKLEPATMSAIPLNHPALHLPARSGHLQTSSISRRTPRSLNISNSRHRHGTLPAVRAMASDTGATAGDVNSSQDSNKETANQQNAPAPVTSGDKAPERKNLPALISWGVGSIFCVAIPFYKKLMVAEDTVQKFVTMVADEVEKAAPFVKNIAEEIEKSLPKDSKLIAKLDTIEKLADDIAEGAEKTEAFVAKVDQVFDKIEDTIDPFIKTKKTKDN